MTVAPSDFLVNYPEFSNGTNYPVPQIQNALNTAYLFVTSHRWGNLQDQGVQLFTAHKLTLSRLRVQRAATGASPGLAQGMLNNKSIDKVSLGYDTQSIAIKDGADWNLTEYGIEFLRIAKMVGAGGKQL